MGSLEVSASRRASARSTLRSGGVRKAAAGSRRRAAGCLGRAEDDQAVVASWVYVGSGYETEGERWLALSAAARAREQRRVVWEELCIAAA